jgi:hypothetical protein
MPDETPSSEIQAANRAGDAEVIRWQTVAANLDLLEAVRAAVALEAVSPAVVDRLRKRWDAADVAIALILVEARSRARGKFADADRLLCDRQAVEQASGERVAAWKARRFGRALEPSSGLADSHSSQGPVSAVWDLCCGMGGDAMALAAIAPARMEVIAVDRSPLRAWMAATNARCRGRVADVTALLEAGVLAGALLHCDPARRDEARGGRTLTPIHEPSLEQCVAIARQAAGAALKLGPGLDPGLLPEDAELEWISDQGTLVQLVAWWGRLREWTDANEVSAWRRATLVGGARSSTNLAIDSDVITICGPVEDVPRADRFARTLAVPDPALERSRLLGHFARCHGLAEPASGLGVLTADTIEASPWLERATVLAEVPFDEQAVISELGRRGAKRARVRTRGGVADADRWTKLIAKGLAGARPAERAGGTPRGAVDELDCFLLRLGSERRAIIAQPLAAS